MTRQEAIERGKVWQLRFSYKEIHFFEGKSRNSCLVWLRENKQMRDYKTGTIRLGQVIWEAQQ